jgi:hypothetical protein
MNNRMTYTQKEKNARKEMIIRAKKIAILKKRMAIFVSILATMMVALIGANAAIEASANEAPSVTWSYQATSCTVQSGDTLYSIAQSMRNSLSEDERDLSYNSVESIAHRLAESNPELGSTFEYASSHLYPGLHLETLLRVEE